MNILITGTSRGIGLAIAREFLEQGHRVYGIDVQEAALAHPQYRHYVADIFHDELPVIYYPYNETEENPRKAEADSKPDIGIQSAGKSQVRIDILINNAGVQNTGQDIDINLKGTMRVTETYGIHPGIKSILFIASASASTGSEFPEYAASKGGVVAYMKNTAIRVAQYGATVNSLSPGGVVNDLNDHILKDPVLWKAVLDETLLGKWAQTQEIAKWAYFLTVINQSMTAQDLLVDNGEAAKFNFIW